LNQCPCNHDLGITCQDALSGTGDGLKTGGTGTRDAIGIDIIQSTCQRDFTSDKRRFRNHYGHAENQLINLVRLEVVTFDQFVHHKAAQIYGTQVTIVRCDPCKRRSYTIDDGDSSILIGEINGTAHGVLLTRKERNNINRIRI